VVILVQRGPEQAPAPDTALPGPAAPAAPGQGEAALPGQAAGTADAGGGTALAVQQDCDVCPLLVAVPAGEYLMGAPASDRDAGAEERPQHRVSLARPFLIGRHEVTFREWDACVADGGCSHTPEDLGWGRDQRPVIQIGWDDALEYVAWLRRKTGRTYRLPTEAEWEYAARAGTVTPYWWGAQIGRGNAVCKGCGSQWDDRQTAPNGSFAPNAFGLHDTSGNVWEWVEDCWSEDYGSTGNDGRPPPPEGECTRRVLRGGSYINKPGNLRSSARAWGAPNGRVNILGFRVARDP
jgi:formylglycine-generating enzyme required for sulfatase activity